MEIAWAAGLFDGEGSVLIHRSAKGYIAELKVDMVGGGEETIARLTRALGGHARWYDRPDGSRVHRWRAHGVACAPIVEALLPHSTTKEAELRLLARFLASHRPGAYTDAERAACASLKDELEALRCSTKRKGSSSRPKS